MSDSPITDNPPVRFDDVSFFYSQMDSGDGPTMDPGQEQEMPRAVENPAEVTQVFGGITVDLPPGVMSLVGQNGIGKSTLLLLAGGRLFPTSGTVKILGKDTRDFEQAPYQPELEEERNRYASFIYQNMEFETEDSIGNLMDFVYQNGYHAEKSSDRLVQIQEALELRELLDKKTQELAKGELQRTIIAFSLLYGSKLILMDEPVFAMEDFRKEQVFEFLMDFAQREQVSIYYSAHDLDLTKKYSDYMMLFWKKGDIQLGPTEELFTRENIEKAYQVPFDMLYRKEYLFRTMLMKMSGAAAGFEDADDQSAGEESESSEDPDSHTGEGDGNGSG